MRRLLVVLGTIVAAVAVLLFVERGTIRDAGESYAYGYPLVIMDATQQTFVATHGAPNTLYNAPGFPGADFREVVRPNVDTLYSIAWLDLSKGPQVLSVPATDRYYVLQFLDGWTNVFASVGPRTTGRGAGAFVLAGPDWRGAAPAGTTLLKAPTNMAWMIGRIQTNGVADYGFVHGLQAQLRLESLEDFVAGRVPATVPWQAAARKPEAPLYQLRSMRPDEFFTRLARLMPANPPAPGDAAALERLDRLGVAPGRPPGRWGPVDRVAIALGMSIAKRRLQAAVEEPRNPHEGWTVPPMNVGDYGTEYGFRAVVAMAGLGANLAADAVYPNAQFDAAGAALDGSRRYVLHFAAGQLPPVRAFWSVTAYDRDGYLVPNAINRYALGDRDPLVRNADGSLDLHLQSQPPPADRAGNWLPVPASGPFRITARLYWPEPTVLDGQWRMPGIRRVD